MEKDPYLTRKTLILRAQDPSDHQAWEDFTGYYTSFIYMVLRRISYNREDHEDLTQEILLKLWGKLQKYEPQKYKFRTWLSTVIRNTVINFIDKKTRRQNREKKSADNEVLNGHLGQDETALSTIIDEEWEIFAINLAMERIRPHFSDKALEVFNMLLDNVSIDEISHVTALKENNICKIKSRLKERLHREVKLIKKELTF